MNRDAVGIVHRSSDMIQVLAPAAAVAPFLVCPAAPPGAGADTPAPSAVFHAAAPESRRLVLGLDAAGDLVLTEDDVVVLRRPRASVAALEIVGSDRDNTLVVDFAHGDPIPSGGLTFDGVKRGTDFDVLALRNAVVETLVDHAYDEHDGRLVLRWQDGRASVLHYRNIEPITSDVTAENVTLDFSSAAETITVSDAGGGQTTVDSDVGGESLTFNNPTGTLTINTGDSGANTVDVDGLAESYPAHVVINGGDGGATVNFNGTVSLASGRSLTVVAGEIVLLPSPAAIIRSDSGDIMLVADQVAVNRTAAIGPGRDLTVRPRTPGTSIGLGFGDGMLDLADLELGRIAGFASITIGDAETGPIEIVDAVFTDPVRIVGSTISVEGDLTAPSVILDGDVSPGGPERRFVFVDRDFAFADGATFTVDIEGGIIDPEASDTDLIVVEGETTIGSGVTLAPRSSDGYIPLRGDRYIIINNNSRDDVSGTFDGLPEGATVSADFLGSGLEATITYSDADENVVIEMEPFGSIALFQGDDLVVQESTEGAGADGRYVLSIGLDSVRIVESENGIWTIHGDQIDSSTVEFEFADFTGDIVIEGGGGDDSLEVVFSEDFPRAVTFDGGGNGAAGDSLKLSPGGAGTFASAAFGFVSESGGRVDLAGNATLTYSGLEGFSSTLGVTDATFTFSTAAETVTLADSGGGQSTIDSDSAGRSFTFANPSGRLTVNPGDSGRNTVDVGSLAADFPADLVINGGNGGDTVNFNGAVSLAPGKSLQVDAVDITAPNETSDIAVAGAGSISLIASNDFILDAGSSLTAADGDITLTGRQAHLDSTAVIRGAGDLRIRPSPSGRFMRLGSDLVSGSMDISDAEIAILADGFRSITFGLDGGGAMTVETVVLTDPATIFGSLFFDGDGTDFSAPGLPLTLRGNVTVGTDLNRAGLLVVEADLAFTGADTVSFNIGGTAAGTGHDQIVVTGTVDLGGAALALADTSPASGYLPAVGDELVLIDNDGADAVTDTFGGLVEGAGLSGDFFGSGLPARITYVGGDGNDVAIEVAPPETTVTLVGGVLTVTDAGGGISDDNLDISYAGGVYTITDGGGLILDASTVAGSTGSLTSTVTVPDTGVSGLAVAAHAGDDSVALRSVQASLGGGLSIDVGATGGGGVSVEAAVHSGAGGVSISARSISLASTATLAATGPGPVELVATRSVNLAPGSEVSTEEGDLAISANRQTPPISGAFDGIDIDGAVVETAGSGNILLAGTGGESGGGNDGVQIRNGGVVRSTGTGAVAGSIDIHGAGGPGTLTNYGVHLMGSGTEVTSVDGAISIVGSGGEGSGERNIGVVFANPTSVSSTGTGPTAAAISITGTGAGASQGHGVVLATTETVRSVDGAVSITGTGGGGSGGSNLGIQSAGGVAATGTATLTAVGIGGNDGIRFLTAFSSPDWRVGAGAMSVTGTAGAGDSTGVSIDHDLLADGGAITITGTGAGDGPGLQLKGGRTLGGSTATGPVTLTADTVDLAGGTVESDGALTVRPKTAATTVGLGGGAGTLNLDDAEIGRLADGFSSITLGDGDTGRTDLASATFSDPVTVFGAPVTDGAGTDITAPGLAVGLRGEVAPGGASPGVLEVAGNLALTVADTLTIEVAGTEPGTGHDQVAVTGAVDLGGAALVLTDTDPPGGYTPSRGDSFRLVDNDGADAVVGTFDGLAEGAFVATDFFGSGFAALITYSGGDGNDVVVRVADSDTSVTLAGGTLLITDHLGASDDDLVISTTGNMATIADAGGLVLDASAVAGSSGSGTAAVTVPLDGVAAISFDLGGGDDRLGLDFSGGLPDGTVPVSVDGGGGSDGIALVGGSFGTVTHDMFDGSSGGLDLFGDAAYDVVYTGLEPVDLTASTAAAFVFNLPDGPGDNAALTDIGGGDLRLASTDTAPGFEPTEFAPPTGALTVNGRGGDDFLDLPDAFAAGGLAFSAEVIQLGAELTTSNGGPATFGGFLRLAADAAVDTSDGGGGDILFAGPVASAGGVSRDLAVDAGPGGDVRFGSTVGGGALVEVGGIVAGEAEDYDRVTASGATSWKILPDEVTPDDNADPVANARGGRYLQLLPDAGGGGSPTEPPSAEYELWIGTPGTYQLFLRWETNARNRGGSDSLFADVIQLKDGGGGAVADWYELARSGDSDFATSPWHGLGEAEVNQAGTAGDPVLWAIPSAGRYTLRLTPREDGAAVDAFVLQLDSLPDPVGDGPAASDRANPLDVLTVRDAGDVTFAAPLEAGSLLQEAGTGTTSFEGEVAAGGFAITGPQVDVLAGVAAGEFLLGGAAGLRVGYNGLSGAVTVSGGPVVIGSGAGALDLGRREINTAAPTFGRLDFSAAASVTIDVGEVRVGSITAGSMNGPAYGEVSLSDAGVNVLTATNVVLGHSTAAGNAVETSTLEFGGGANTVRADAFTVGGAKSRATVTIGAGGSLHLAGRSAAAADLSVGANTVDTGSVSTGVLDLTSGTFDAVLDELVLGRHNRGNGGGRGTFRFAAGTVAAASVLLADPDAAGESANDASSQGTVDQSGGELAVAGELAGGGGAAVYNLSGGTLRTASLRRGPGAGTFAFDWSGGTVGNPAGAAFLVVDVPLALSAPGPQTFSVAAGRSGSLLSAAPLSGPGALTISNDGFFSVAALGEVADLTVSGAGETRLDGATTGPLALLSGARLAPGVGGPGALASGDLSLAPGSSLRFDIDGVGAGSGHGQVAVTGTVALGGADLVLATSGLTASDGDAFTLVDNDGADAVAGSFAGLAEGATVTDEFLGTGLYAVISYAGGDGNDVVVTVDERAAGYVDFVARYFPGGGDPGTVTGPGADPDGDGFPNFIEYALGLDPGTADGGGVQTQVVPGVGGDFLELRFDRPADARGLTYSGEVWSGEGPWLSGSQHIELVAVAPSADPSFETVTLRALAPVSGTFQMVRLRVSFVAP